MLVVAALKRELTEIARKQGADLVVLDTGEGPPNATRVLNGWLAAHPARAVINVGLGGALSRTLETGDLVIAREICGEGRVFDASRSPLFALGERIAGARTGVAITVDHMVCKASDKRRLADSLGTAGVAWVDMESAAIAAVCEKFGVPYVIVRAISDAFDEDLPLDFNRCRDREGRVSNLKVIRAALVQPRAIKGLMQLRRRADLCAGNLASFVRQLVPRL